MKVIKVGGGCLSDTTTIARIMELIASLGPGQVFVVSALKGVTDYLIGGMNQALEGEDRIPEIIRHLREKHLRVARQIIKKPDSLAQFDQELNQELGRLERLYYGLSFTRELSPRMYDMISSFGECFSAELLSHIMRARNVAAACRMPHQIGLITDGKHGDASADLSQSGPNLKSNLTDVLDGKQILFIPGFFGVNPKGDITTFGRGGSDYSASVVAVALEAEILEIWKDVDGFMSADPSLVPEARLIPVLSYDEAAELAYFGAKILHPRSVEPVRREKLNISIRNTLHPEVEGSLITSRSPCTRNVIKSVSHSTDIGILNVHASGVGVRPGILAQVAGSLTDSGINIRSVVTSQTCISLLLAKKDLNPGRLALQSLVPRPYRHLESLEDVALIAIVGAGMCDRQGIAAKCFTAVAGCNVNVEMISFGPSRAALYFLVKRKDLKPAVLAIHSTFFSTPRCQ